MASLYEKSTALGRRGTRSRSNARKFRHQRITSFLSSAVVSLTIGLMAQPVFAQGGPAAGAQIVTVQASAAGSSVTLGGTVVAFKEVTLTAQIPGRVEFLAGTEGDSFKANDILVAIDDDDLSGNPAGGIRTQENGHVGHFIGTADSAERGPPDHLSQHIVIIWEGLKGIGVNEAARDGIDVNRLRRQFVGQVAGQGLDGGLGDADRGVTGDISC